MTEDERLKEYSRRFIYDGYMLEDREINIINKSLGFKRYLLTFAVKDLKKEIFNALPLWLQRFMGGET